MIEPWMKLRQTFNGGNSDSGTKLEGVYREAWRNVASEAERLFGKTTEEKAVLEATLSLDAKALAESRFGSRLQEAIYAYRHANTPKWTINDHYIGERWFASVTKGQEVDSYWPSTKRAQERADFLNKK